jgi:hypothetical protein
MNKEALTINCNEMIALKATLEPILMRDSKAVMVHVTNTEFRGTVLLWP